jgi:DNA polymerase-3 subunit gamma/tau
MSYIVFARKYRPQTFDDVIGQSHITTTLKNAITQSRVAHAYLFAGPRGVGKTTTARIFAKALNCEKGPTAKPCNKCASCEEITKGSGLDILEIDGASNRGVEEIRSLRENVKFAPSKGRYKVYIIDEVHMLSAEAFNALLKTLEEPPPHVIFIFATTAPHKVLPTILSRCQRFDFRRIAARDILDNLRTIVKDEKVDVKDEALGLIAKCGDGSMRDAQVILDQITSFRRGAVTVEDVTRMLGIVDDDVLFGLSGAISQRDAAAALATIDRMMNEGKDAFQVVLGLIEHFRNISVAKISADAGALIDAGPDRLARYRSEAEKFTIEEVLYIIYTLSNTIDFIRKTTLARVPFEAAMVKLTQVRAVVSLPEILSKIEALQKAAPAPAAKAARPAAPAPADPPSDPPAQASPQAGSIDLEEMSGYWIKIVNHIKPKKISVASYMQEGYPTAVESGTLTVSFPKECQFHKEVLESPENRRVMEEAIETVTGLKLKIILTLIEPAAGRDRSSRPDANVSAGGEDLPAENADQSESDPAIRAALNIFGGKITGNGKDKGAR